MKSVWDGAWNGATGERQHGCIAPNIKVHRDIKEIPCVQTCMNCQRCGGLSSSRSMVARYYQDSRGSN